MCYPQVITIDGPAGSGKTTLGKMLADYLGYLFFDTGIMYRAVTYAAITQGINPTDEAAVNNLAETITIDVRPRSQEDGRTVDTFIDGEDVTWEIRLPEVDANVSIISAYPRVRRALGIQQRRIGSQGKIVMIGRDIGTVILPEAELKIYLDASVEERARRRYTEQSLRDETADPEEIFQSLEDRDRIDTTRSVAPLKPADDAVLVDTEGLDIQEAFLQLIELVERRCDKHDS
jgi:cytidylate kinase